MKKYNILLLLPFLALVLILGLFIFDVNLKVKSPDPEFKLKSALIGQKVPEFELDQLKDFSKPSAEDLYSNEFKLVNFWASWCAPCRAEHPLFMKLQASGYKIYGINYKDKADNALNFLASLGNPYLKIGADKSGRVAINWGLYGVPETFIINSRGEIIYRHAGPVTETIFNREFLPRMSD